MYVDPGILIILRMAINIDPVTRFFFRHLHNMVLVVYNRTRKISSENFIYDESKNLSAGTYFLKVRVNIGSTEGRVQVLPGTLLNLEHLFSHAKQAY